MVGRVEALAPLAERRWRVAISYDPATVGSEVPQLLNLLFGNISMKPAILVTGIEWPDPLLGALGGPRLGIAGIRALCRVSERRPLLCTALKPVGLSAQQLAELCYRFALGGIDIIKDDHNLADQPTAPFRERVARCQEAVSQANGETGGHSVYFPQLARGSPAIQEDLALAREAGCRGVMVSPVIVGLDTVRWLAAASGMAVFAHPSMSGVFFQPGHGILPEILYGELYRIVGSDGVIYTNAGDGSTSPKPPATRSTPICASRSVRCDRPSPCPAAAWTWRVPPIGSSVTAWTPSCSSGAASTLKVT